MHTVSRNDSRRVRTFRPTRRSARVRRIQPVAPDVPDRLPPGREPGVSAFG